MRKIAVMLVGVGALVLASITAAGAQTATGMVTVIHGVPGLTVDVYVNGDLTLEAFAPDTLTDPLELPEGSYQIDIYPAGADPAADAPAIAGTATLPAGASASIIAHLAADGSPVLSVFVNDVSEIASGNARLTVRHTAAAPAVDVLANGDALFTNLANPDERSADVPAGTYSAAVAATGTTDPVIGPADLTLDAGTAYFVFAVGSLDQANLNLLIQTVSGLRAPQATTLPDAGTGADATSSGGTIRLAAALGVMGLIVLGATASFARSRARRR